MNNIKFITTGLPKEGEMVIYRGHYTYGDGIALEAWDMYEPYAVITVNIPKIPIASDEVIIHHDLMSEHCERFLSDFLEYMTDGSREIRFGPYNTRTLVVKLKENWKELCVPMEV